MKNKFLLFFGKVTRRISPVSFAAFIAFVLLSLITAYAAIPLDGEEQLRCGIIRFHVLANSDSKDDQELKLAVRDAVTDYTSGILEDCADISLAKEIINKNSDEIVRLAKRCIRDNGYSYDVRFAAGFENYPRRIYGKYTFPAGEYYSVRLEIGKAKGKNWWCVLFPPMCISGAVAEKYDNPAELKEIGFSDAETALISEPLNTRTEIRFFFLDMLSKIK